MDGDGGAQFEVEGEAEAAIFSFGLCDGPLGEVEGFGVLFKEVADGGLGEGLLDVFTDALAVHLAEDLGGDFSRSEARDFRSFA